MTTDTRCRRLLLPLLVAGVMLAITGCREETPLPPSARAVALDRQIDWTDARLIVVQNNNRYKPLDSFAREWIGAMTRRDHLPGLSPSASALEWVFNNEAYADVPLIKLHAPRVISRLSEHLDDTARERILSTKCLTPNEMADERFQRTLRSMEGDPSLRRTVNEVRTARIVSQRMPEMLTIVPAPGGNAIDPWVTPRGVLGSLSDEYLAKLGLTRADLPEEHRAPVAGLSPEQARTIVATWSALRSAWLEGRTADVQQNLDTLVAVLPTLAPDGVYPQRSQRVAEVRYYAFGKFTGGWTVYLLGVFFSIVALTTRSRIAWGATIALLLGGLTFHAYGLGLRWYILNRIPVADHFESLVAAAWMGIIIVLLIELFLRTRVLLVGAHATGFVGLVVAQLVPSGGRLATVPGILNDIQLRLHTTLVIAAYALIMVGAIIAIIYLVGFFYVWITRPETRHGAGPSVADEVSADRPLLAGALPGDEERGTMLPTWLNNIDWAHMVVLNIVFILLFFGGLILGAWWADYSWGRPWGWDPKEVFALSTWLVYAVLLHLRFVTRNRGLWSACLSLVGFVMMTINGFIVNYHIPSIHSYA